MKGEEEGRGRRERKKGEETPVLGRVRTTHSTYHVHTAHSTQHRAGFLLYVTTYLNTSQQPINTYVGDDDADHEDEATSKQPI